jgi:hypothetical protein
MSEKQMTQQNNYENITNDFNRKQAAAMGMMGLNVQTTYQNNN